MSVTDDKIRATLKRTGGNKAAAARNLGMAPSTLKSRLQRMENIPDEIPDLSISEGGQNWKEDRSENTWVIVCQGADFSSPEEVLAEAKVDLDVWEIERIQIGRSTVTFKGQKDHVVLKEKGDTTPGTKQLWRTTGVRAVNPNIKITLKRKVDKRTEDVVSTFLSRLEDKAPIVPKIRRAVPQDVGHRRQLEICLLDPHYGMRCFPPESDAEWSPDLCANMVLDSLELILKRAKAYGPFEKIVMPMGNDFFHTDSIWQTTTAGTPQPEADAYYHSFVTGEQLAVNIIERVKEEADVELYFIPGNHDRSTSFMLGRVINALYSRDSNVTVHADASPYKFHRFGVNLIGFEHGHSIAPIRLAALMANEVPEDWAETKFREWHLGDQHRKGSSKPSVMEEQGVSVEFLPGLTAPNEWHRLKGFNWQKRGTFGFVWDYHEGQLGRIQANVDARQNCLLGRH